MTRVVNSPTADDRHDGEQLTTPGCGQVFTLTGDALELRVDHTVDAIIGVLAARQRQVVARSQLLAAGVSPRAIEHRVARGRLHAIHRGVYLAGSAELLPLGRETAALLVCGPNAALSHRTAAAIWRIVTFVPSAIDVLVVGRNPRPRGAVRVHRAQKLDTSELRRRDALVVTSPSRTLIDLAGVVDERTLRRSVEEALRLRLVRSGEVLAALERAPRRHGAPALRAALSANDAPAMTRSEAERRLLDLLRVAGLPAPATNVRVAGFEVDAVWRAERLIAEVDGFAFHASREAFERDRRRDAALQAAGWRVVRLTWRRLVDEPEAVVALIAGLLAQRA